MAAIELPTGQWPDLIQKLLDNMEAEPAKSALRQSTLEALGYICEELGNIEQDVLEQAQVNNILTSVAKGMRKEEPDMSVRRAATVALYNAIIFAQTNFENATERNYLMQIICEGTVAQDARVREASFECLVKIAANYYEKLPAYMQQIFSLTHHAALQDEEDVAKQAIEFWCTVCEEEIDIQQVILAMRPVRPLRLPQCLGISYLPRPLAGYCRAGSKASVPCQYGSQGCSVCFFTNVADICCAMITLAPYLDPWAYALQEQDEGDSSTLHYHFVQQALQPLVEMLLKLLSKQEEGQDEDDGIWNLSLAGGNCLSLVAAVVGDEVLALVMPYIQVCLPDL